MKTKLLLALFAFVLIATTPALAQDTGNPDSLVVLTSVPDLAGNDSIFIVEVYVYHDQNTLSGFSSGFSWENDNLHLDSTRISPAGVSAFAGNWILYPNNSIDSANARQAFACVGFWFLNGSMLPASADKQLMVSYYFTLSSWSALDTIAIDTFNYTDGVELGFQDSVSGEYLPVWAGGDFPIYVLDPTDASGGIDGNLPTSYSLAQNYPNPFNPGTMIEFAMPVAGEYTLTVYNVLGQVVREFREHAGAGYHSVEFDASEYSSGVYFYKLSVNNFTETKKMMLVK